MEASLVAAGLLGIRMLPIFVVAPVPLFRRMPLPARVAFAALLALVFAAALPARGDELSLAACAREFLLGSVLAFGFHAAIAAAHTFGHVLDLQLGFGAASLFDPATEHANTLVAELLQIVVLVGFFALDGHHALLRGFAAMIEVVPPGAEFALEPALFAQLGAHFGIGLALVAPLMLLMWLLDFALALMSRAAPQANIYFVAIPLKLALGLCGLAWLSTRVLPLLAGLLRSVLDGWLASVSARA